jgi:hypothetical protein
MDPPEKRKIYDSADYVKDKLMYFYKFYETLFIKSSFLIGEKNKKRVHHSIKLTTKYFFRPKI